MGVDQRLRPVTETLNMILARGFIVSEGELHFFDSTFGLSGTDEIIHYLNSDDSDLDTFLELVISPDEATQIELEPILQKAELKDNEIETVVNYISGKHQKTIIGFPNHDERVDVMVPHYILERFIKKLRPENNPPEEIRIASASVSGENRLKVCVILRNSTLILNPVIIGFITRFFSGEQRFGGDFCAIFAFSVSILEEKKNSLVPETQEAIRHVFVERKRHYEKVLSEVIEGEKKRATTAVETIMMQGGRIPPNSKDSVLDAIRKLERVLEIIFCFIDQPRRPEPVETDLGNVAGVDDMQSVFRKLS